MEEKKVDATALAAALRTLGIFYGAERPLADVIAGATDEVEAIRAYIKAERAHLLTCYDMEALIGLVLAARNGTLEAPASIEAFRVTAGKTA